MQLEGAKSIANRLAYAALAVAIGVSSAGCFYSRTVDTEPAPIPQVVQLPAPVVYQTTTPTVATVPVQHDVTTSWGPGGTVQKQTTTLSDPDGVPVQKQTTTTWEPGSPTENQTTTTTTNASY